MGILESRAPEETRRCRRNQFQSNASDLHMNNTEPTTYSRDSLRSIRRLYSCSVDSAVLRLLKINGLLRFRGSRAGTRKIPVV